MNDSIMKSSQTIYKRVKIHWWIILFFWGIYVWMIFAYIHQWGNNPMNKTGLVIFSVIWIAVSIFILVERFILTIDDKFFVVTFGSYWDIKIHITQIKNVSVEKLNFRMYVKTVSHRGTKYQFDFTSQTVKIQTKSGKIYQIHIKNAQRIKEEIEKQMLIHNNITPIS
jgi:hypothetical protein